MARHQALRTARAGPAAATGASGGPDAMSTSPNDFVELLQQFLVQAVGERCPSTRSAMQCSGWSISQVREPGIAQRRPAAPDHGM